MKHAKLVIGLLLIVVMMVGGAAWLAVGQRTTPPQQSTVTPSPSTPAPQSTPSTPAPTTKPAGFYGDYSDQRIALHYDKTILFFHAPWCNECRAFDKVLRESTIPQDIQILKVDYDSRQDLRQKYGVTLQGTFVEIDDDGDAEYDRWVGYGKDKSLDAILRNLE